MQDGARWCKIVQDNATFGVKIYFGVKIFFGENFFGLNFFFVTFF